MHLLYSIFSEYIFVNHENERNLKQKFYISKKYLKNEF